MTDSYPIQKSKINFVQPILFVLWVFIGITLYVRGGCNVFVWPFLLFGWWLVALAWIAARRWGALAIFIAPVLTIVAWLVTYSVHDAYVNWAANRALRDFIAQTSVGSYSANYSYREMELEQAQLDFSRTYTIEYEDNFLGSREWIARFPNGSRYFISVSESCFGPLYVGAEKLRDN